MVGYIMVIATYMNTSETGIPAAMAMLLQPFYGLTSTGLCCVCFVLCGIVDKLCQQHDCYRFGYAIHVQFLTNDWNGTNRDDLLTLPVSAVCIDDSGGFTCHCSMYDAGNGRF